MALSCVKARCRSMTLKRYWDSRKYPVPNITRWPDSLCHDWGGSRSPAITSISPAGISRLSMWTVLGSVSYWQREALATLSRYRRQHAGSADVIINLTRGRPHHAINRLMHKWRIELDHATEFAHSAPEAHDATIVLLNGTIGVHCLYFSSRSCDGMRVLCRPDA